MAKNAEKIVEAESETPENKEATPDSQAPTPEVSPPVKRGRGRPPKNPQASNGAGNEIPGNAAPVAKRGRPPSKLKGLSIEAQANLAKQIQGLHFIAATATGLPELQISDQEAAMLADGIAAVSREYGLSMDGKTGAALQLIAAAAIVYAPRFKAINNRARMQTANQETETQNVPPPTVN